MRVPRMNNNNFTEQLNFNIHIYGAKIWSIMFNLGQNCVDLE